MMLTVYGEREKLICFIKNKSIHDSKNLLIDGLSNICINI